MGGGWGAGWTGEGIRKYKLVTTEQLRGRKVRPREGSQYCGLCVVPGGHQTHLVGSLRKWLRTSSPCAVHLKLT